MRLDCVRIVEAAYSPRPTEAEWLEGLLEPFEPLARGMGVIGTLLDLGAPDPSPKVWASRSARPDLVRAFQRSRGYLARECPEAFRRIHVPGRNIACWASQLAGSFPEEAIGRARELFAGTGRGDSLGVLAADPQGLAVVVTLPAERRYAVPPRTVRQLARVTAHLATSLRLRARLQGAGEAGARVEAVLDPKGKVHDASGAATPAAARASLAEAVRSVERARGGLRRTDPDEALAIWRALFDGRWSIVERSEADGKRFLLARRNEPGFADPRALAPGERDVLAYAARGLSNKYIGYLLGVATSTAATRLASGMRKLGLSSRREVIAFLAGAVPAATQRERA